MEFLAYLMGLGPSVLLYRSEVGTQLTALFDKSIMARTNQPSKEKGQSIITLGIEGQPVPDCPRKGRPRVTSVIHLSHQRQKSQVNTSN